MASRLPPATIDADPTVSPGPPDRLRAALVPPRAAEALAVVGAWALVGAVSVVRRGLLDPIPVTGHTVAVSVVEVGPWLLVTPVVLWLARRVPLRRERWAARVGVHAVAAVAAIAFATAVQTVGMPLLGPPPGLGAMPGLDAMPPVGAMPPGGPGMMDDEPGGSRGGPGGPDAGGPLLPLSFQVAAYLVVLGVGVARASAQQLAERQAEADRLRAHAQRLDAERERLAGQLAAARLDALRMQLNP
ncbi:MAG TPA: hypothetical protein VGB53_13985, partial [Rubricoccaceae bacterium]